MEGKMDAHKMQSKSMRHLPTGTSKLRDSILAQIPPRREPEISNYSNFQNIGQSAASSTPSSLNAYHMPDSSVPAEDVLEIIARRMDLQRPPSSDGFKRAGDSAGPPPHPASENQ